MEHLYNQIVGQLRNLLIPPPANQLEMNFYYYRLLAVLQDTKDTIEDAQEMLKARLQDLRNDRE